MPELSQAEMDRMLDSLERQYQQLMGELRSAAFALSLNQERVADILTPGSHMGQSARIQAVKMAISASDWERADQLVARFVAEPDLPRQVKRVLRKLVRR